MLCEKISYVGPFQKKGIRLLHHRKSLRNRVVIIKNITQQLGFKKKMDFSQERKTCTNHFANICGLHFKTYLNEGFAEHLWTKLMSKIELTTY